jgi:hypothetical protein
MISSGDETSRPFDVILAGIPSRRHLGWDAAEDDGQERGKKKRMMGLEPTTFCMASRSGSSP